MSWNDRPLSDLLRVLSASSMVPEDDDKRLLATAADALDRLLPARPTVLITAGYEADAVVLEVGYMADSLDRIFDDLAVLRDGVETVQRELKRQAKARLSGGAGT